MSTAYLTQWVVILSLTSQSAEGAEKKAIVLWPQGAPGAVGSEEADVPTLRG